VAALAVAIAGGVGLWLAREDPQAARRAFVRTPGPMVVNDLHRVEVGSTPDEFRDAIALCRRTDPTCDASWFASEAERKVVLAPYALDLREVSVGDFADFVARTGHVTSAEQRGSGYHQFVEVEGLDWRHPAPGHGEVASELPVVQVSHFDAEAFCEYAGMRLPTEDEWEHAAKGDARRIFPWGDQWEPDRVVWGASDFGVVEAVDGRSEGESALGHRHLVGNVAEWTSTISRGDRIIKGGSWQETNPAQLRSAVRAAESPEYASSDVGFRCVYEPVAVD
jgi:formylglycine-generating enzyme required for sulfatase activity